MIRTVAIYDSTTGEILRTLKGSADKSGYQAGEGDAVFYGPARDDLHWIDPATGERQDREAMNPTMTTADGEATITGLPDPCEVRCLGETEEVTGGTITIEVDEPGSYTVELRARPQYFDHTLEVEIP